MIFFLFPWPFSHVPDGGFVFLEHLLMRTALAQQNRAPIPQGVKSVITIRITSFIR